MSAAFAICKSKGICLMMLVMMLSALQDMSVSQTPCLMPQASSVLLVVELA